MSMFHQFHELWVAAGPFSVLGSVLVALIVLLFAWLALKDCPFGWVEARARAGRGFVNVSHRFESEWSAVDVLSYRVHRGKLIVHYRVTNRSDEFCGFGANQFRASSMASHRPVRTRGRLSAGLGTECDVASRRQCDVEPDVPPM